MFNTQTGATTAQRQQIGWGQSQAIQSGIGSGLQAAKMREQRAQWQKGFEQQQSQFDTRMGWEQQRFDKESKMAQKQFEYQKKQDEKAERIGMFGTAVEMGKTGMSIDYEGLSTDIDAAFGWGEEGELGGGATQVKGHEAGMTHAETVSTPGGGADPSTTKPASYSERGNAGEGPRGTGVSGSGGGGPAWYSSPGGWGATLAGGAAGGMTGSFLSQAIFGQGKTQSTAGGAAGGAVGGYSASGGSGYGALAGAFVGGVMGYFMG